MKEPSVQPRHSARGAVVLLLPRSVWPALDAIREQHDAQIVRWMPHLPLLYPFVVPELFDSALPRVAEACRGIGPLTVRLATVSHTLLESGRGTLWVACEPEEPLVDLRGRLQEAFPELGRKDQATGAPHIPVGQCRTHLVARRIAKELAEGWSAVSVEIGALSLVGRERSGPFQVLHEIPLGGARN